MDRSYLGWIERGEVNPTLEKLYEIVAKLEVTPDKLLPAAIKNSALCAFR
jgi:transcriptional regulator with XRE-family HTH domain